MCVLIGVYIFSEYIKHRTYRRNGMCIHFTQAIFHSPAAHDSCYCMDSSAPDRMAALQCG